MRTCQLSKLIFLSLVAGFPLVAQGGQAAQKDIDTEVLDLLELLNTPVTTASKRAERMIESPSVVSVVTRSQFQDYGWTSVNDALYSLPGFGPSQDYDRRTVSSRGLFEGWNNNHILMLVDGIPYNDNIYGSAYTWEITPVFMIKTLEVVRGPGSALYGSNSTNSATQLKTISAKDLPNGGEAQVRLGQKGERVWDFAVGHQGDLISAVAAFNSYQTDGNSYMDYDGSLRGYTAPVTPPLPTSKKDGQPSRATREYANGLPLDKFYVNDARNSQYGWAKLEGEGALKGWNFQYHNQAWDYKTGHGWLWQIPDMGESMREKRQIISLSYKGTMGSHWEQEYMVTHQRHDVDWMMRFYPNQGFSNWYPTGGWEYLNSGASTWFARGQWAINLPRGSSLLFGVEANRFLYTGDSQHSANILMDPVTYFPPTSDNGFVQLGPWLAYVQNKPILNTGYYAQFSSGKLMGDMFKAVLGVRFDKASVDYHKLDAQYLPTGLEGSKSYSNTSPRVALVFMPKDNLAIKAMFGKAFRSPAPSELAGANTFTLASNIENLKPETLNTIELAVDWIINSNLNWRTNLYHTKFKDQIFYSAQHSNLSTNIYTATTEGVETELLYGFSKWKGFLNYAFARRVDEEILDNTITPSKDKLTWEPSQRLKVGVIFTYGHFTGALSGLYQGKVERRASDVGTQLIPLLAGATFDVDPYRPRTLDAWFTLDTKLTYNFTKKSNMSLIATNLLDTDKNVLVKNLAFPFDYKGQERRVAVSFKTSF